ncbi:MAG TPA: DUF3501 family protein [Candidatus Binatia bacterium]|nr:DUF3501 family protein [Candidatus Binatia bacterium]
MAGLRAEDLRVGAAYDRNRAEARAESIELRRRRRVQIGGLVSIVFENRDTLRAAAEEGLRAERLEGAAEVAAEAGRFQSLLPAPGTLAASFYLEVSDPHDLTGLSPDLDGLAAGVYVEVAGARTAGEVAPSPAPSPAAYLRFPLTTAQREAWLEGAPVRVGVSHPRCTATVDLSDEQRAAVAVDLRTGPGAGGRPADA